MLLSATPTVFESARLSALADLKILDTPHETVFEDVTRLAANVFKVPIYALSLIDAHRQWFKSSVGLNITESIRNIAFCDHVIRTDEILFVPDAANDERFKNNPLVTGRPNIRFYAGAPVKYLGFNIGMLFIIDNKFKERFDAEDLESLKNFGDLTSSILQLRQHSWTSILNYI